MPALAENQRRCKTLLWETYQQLGVEEVKWTWDWIVGELGKWDEITAWAVLANHAKKSPTELPTYPELLAAAKRRNKKIIARTPAEPVTRQNPHRENT